MTPLTIALVLCSACFHALWNFVSKKANGGTAFVWLFAAIETVLYFPIFLYILIIDQYVLDPISILFITGSGLLHLAYFLLLTKGYQVGDLSIVYPLARGSGPLLAVIGAILLFGERPTLLALTGGLLICGGVIWLTGDPRNLRQNDALPGVTYAALTGLAIASYTLWDAYAVSQLLIPPLVFQWGLSTSRCLLLTPYALKNRESIRQSWRRDKKKALVVAIFSSLSYILILWALSISPVSYIAPMRVISTLIGVALGTQLLGEGDTFRRLSAATAMMGGVIALSIG